MNEPRPTFGLPSQVGSYPATVSIEETLGDDRPGSDWVVQVRRSTREGWWFWRLYSPKNRERVAHSQLYPNKGSAVKTATALSELAGLELSVEV